MVVRKESHFTEDGSYDLERSGHHTHSTTCAMSSLAQLHGLTQDVGLVERARAFYERGLAACCKTITFPTRHGGYTISPDFNPIEQAVAKITTHLRTTQAQAFDTLVVDIRQALDMVTPADARGGFAPCGFTLSNHLLGSAL